MILPVFVLPVFVLPVFACIFCLQTFYLHLPVLADMPAFVYQPRTLVDSTASLLAWLRRARIGRSTKPIINAGIINNSK